MATEHSGSTGSADDTRNLLKWALIGQDVTATVAVCCIAVFGGLVVAVLYAPSGRGGAFLWGLACLGLGALTGFLFGIPKVLQSVRPDAAAKDAPDSRLVVNTNLEQISDWVTKIIVGLTLVQFNHFRQAFWGLAAFLASGMGGSRDAQVFAAGLIIYFVVVGFFGGYLLTRIYLTPAFRRADWNTEHMVLATGDLTLVEFANQQKGLVRDLQAQVVQIQQQTGVAPKAEAVAGPLRSVLWVDDHPKNNALLIDTLVQFGVKVVTALSTAAALDQLKSVQFDRIISDMGRTEGGSYNPEAGLELITAVTGLGMRIPILIYCARDMEARYRADALQRGAEAVTSSPTALLAALNINSAAAAAGRV